MRPESEWCRRPSIRTRARSAVVAGILLGMVTAGVAVMLPASATAATDWNCFGYTGTTIFCEDETGEVYECTEGRERRLVM